MTSLSNRKKLRHALTGAFALTIVAFAWDFVPVARQFEQATLDLRYRHFNRDAKASDRIVYVDIDEQSLKLLASSYGRWPWPRRVYKDIVEFFSIGEPAAILFDVTFSEAMRGTDDDRLLAEASKAGSRVSHGVNLLTDRAEDGEGVVKLPADFAKTYGLKWTADPGLDFSVPKRPFVDIMLPAAPYLETKPRLHVITFGLDPDGVYRRVRMAYRYDDAWLPAMALAGVMATLPDPTVARTDTGLRLTGSDGRTLDVPLDADGTFPMHFYSLENGTPRVPFAVAVASAMKLQKGEVSDPKELKENPLDYKDKIIVIGGSAAGLGDLKITPVSQAFPGPLLHVTAMSNILQQDFVKRVPAWARLANNLAGLFFTYFGVFFFEHILLKIGAPALIFAGYLGVTALVFHMFGVWLDVALPFTLFICVMLDGLAYMSFIEGREKKKIKGALAKYLSPAVTDQIVSSGRDPSAEVGRAQQLSILFSDIRGFTTLSEALPPDVLVARLNDYLARMTDEIFMAKGTLDKFIGDAIMAFWGAPLEEPQHALKAVRCAMAMQDALRDVRKVWAEKGYDQVKDLSVGIGINTGKVIVGNIGSEKRLDYTVIGDNVNLASRIEGLTKQYHVGFLIGPDTYEAVKGEFLCRLIDMVKVKGKHHGVSIYEPLCAHADANAGSMKELAELFAIAFDHYQKGAFSKALECFIAMNQVRPGGDGPSQVYIERCRELLASAPKDWDGVYVAKSK